MLKNILKISLALCLLLALVQAKNKTQVEVSVYDDFPVGLEMPPFVRVGKKFYYFGLNKLSWLQAFLKCRSMDGFLVSFNSEEELDELSKYMAVEYPFRWWWTSGSDLDREGDFYWYGTGERLTFGWTTGQPDSANDSENCAHLWDIGGKYELNDLNCSQQINYVCESKQPKTIGIVLY